MALHLRLPAQVRSVPLARREVTDFVLASDPGLPADPAAVGPVDVVALLTTELVANAVLHGHGQVLVLEARRSPEDVWVSCTDDNPSPPVLREVSVEATGGRGIALIAALAGAWGWEPLELGGKRVWFRVPL